MFFFTLIDRFYPGKAGCLPPPAPPRSCCHGLDLGAAQTGMLVSSATVCQIPLPDGNCPCVLEELLSGALHQGQQALPAVRPQHHMRADPEPDGVPPRDGQHPGGRVAAARAEALRRLAHFPPALHRRRIIRWLRQYHWSVTRLWLEDPHVPLVP